MFHFEVTPTRFWKWFYLKDFDENSFETIARGNFGEVRKAKFQNLQALQVKQRPSFYADTWAALKSPLGEKHNFTKQIHDLCHEVSCAVILHPVLGESFLR